MIEIDQVQATIARLRAKLRASRPDDKLYYELCLAGWLRWLKKIESEDQNDSNAHQPGF